MSFAVVGEVISGRYELEELLGVGGMSNVYRARDRLLERTVALKVLHDRYSNDDEYVERFRREARSAARLSHPGIVTVIDRGEEEGHQYIVFEHVEGETLKQLVNREGPLPVRLALELALQIGRALSFAHAQGVVHRDVKPQNVLLNGDGRAKVADFGIARAVDVDGGTTTGVVVGTSHYLAPEQAKGEHANAQSDVYALGAVLYELLSGDVPFPGENFVVVAMRHVNEPLPSLLQKRPELPLRVVAAVERALEKKQLKRFASMNAFMDELEACLAELPTGAEQDATEIIRGPLVPPDEHTDFIPAPPVRHRRRRWVWPLVTLLAVLAAGAIAAGIYLTRHTGSSGPDHGGASVHLRAVAAYDPFGDKGENDDIVGRATDGNTTTYWETETYRSGELFGPNGQPKLGVGIVFDAGKSTVLRRLTVTSDSPGFTAVIRSSDSRGGGFVDDSESQTAQAHTTFSLDGKTARYYLLWITKLNGVVQVVKVNEVKAG